MNELEIILNDAQKGFILKQDSIYNRILKLVERYDASDVKDFEEFLKCQSDEFDIEFQPAY